MRIHLPGSYFHSGCMDKVLIVEDADSLRDILGQVLRAHGYDVQATATAEEALERLQTEEFNLILSDLKLPGMNGLEFIRETRAVRRTVPVVVMTAYGNISIAVEAMKEGATDFITKPFEPESLCHLLEQVLEHRRIIDRNSRPKRKRSFITQSKAVEDLLAQARRVAPLSSPVLILGESGTGKELVARYIHDHSLRAQEQFVAVNCGSMPSDLLESEFFGHEAGAFTGAAETRIGLFEVAHNGTIFLDEIGNMPVALQTKLLRALQESEIKRLGSTKYQKVDTRIISATNSDIAAEIKSNRFREDLYYRLGVVILEIPPLRKRAEDIPLLVNYFLKALCFEFGRELPQVTPAAMKFLQSYDWPGNVRELENAIERALIMNDGPLNPKAFQLGSGVIGKNEPQKVNLQEAVNEAVQRTEREIISKMLAQTFGNKSKAAELLGISYKTLLNKVKEYQLDSSNAPTSEEQSAH